MMKNACLFSQNLLQLAIASMAWGHWKSLRPWHDLESVESIGLALASERKKCTRRQGQMRCRCSDMRDHILQCATVWGYAWMYVCHLADSCLSVYGVFCRMLPFVFNFTSVHDSTRKRFCTILWLNSDVWPTCNTLKQKGILFCKTKLQGDVTQRHYTVIHPQHWKTCHTLPRQSLEALGSGFVGRSEVECRESEWKTFCQKVSI